MSDKNTKSLNTGVELERHYGFPSLVFFGLVFMGPSIILTIFGVEQITTNGHITIAMALATVIAIISCLSYAKMVEIFPNAGSSYAFTTKGVNPKLGFMAGWAMLVDYCVSPMFMFAVCGRYFSRLYPVFSWQVWVLIVAAIVLIMNVLGLKASKVFNLGAGILQLGMALLLSILGVLYLNTNGAPEPISTVIFDAEDFTSMGLFAGMAIAFMSFLGFDGITTLAEEATVSPKKMGNAIVVSVLLQGLCLTGVGLVCAMMMPGEAHIANPDTVGVDLFNTVQSSTVFTSVIMTIKQCLVIMAAVNITTAASRLLYAMGRQGVIPNRVFGKLNAKTHTPVVNIIICVALYMIGSLFFDWVTLSEVVSFGGLFGFTCVNLAVINYFWIRKHDRQHIFRSLILPIIATGANIFAICFASTPCKVIGIIWTIIGIIYLFIGYKVSPKFREAIDTGKMM